MSCVRIVHRFPGHTCAVCVCDECACELCVSDSACGVCSVRCVFCDLHLARPRYSVAILVGSFGAKEIKTEVLNGQSETAMAKTKAYKVSGGAHPSCPSILLAFKHEWVRSLHMSSMPRRSC